jgi:hypothetical protein
MMMMMMMMAVVIVNCDFSRQDVKNKIDFHMQSADQLLWRPASPIFLQGVCPTLPLSQYQTQ